ncbi:REP element-mobilizing transposase RayT [Mesoflavibacter sabulilitoris]|uniref:Transposase n=1 Tax=Mesoflavibacter zeaxanthinifaciens subsp. sabulilitoris TaxID=1520893 RepID=A0A2T1N608_9FLAO|nr:transposase [Mesoflavibacter zeaxanthinifaciens]MBB3123360.1 REP element-mobilizing transposase RayT [Mesoflavibacter zeaxanthinifaciens subsp. sabulilitoris]PSG87008.1 transposase [Mesoflavibacter zeaxanthinifaciens subsp. sabulilitoris]
MSTKYKATEQDAVYFITITVVGWVDVFTRLRQKDIIINALQYCQKHKGLEVYAYCLMSSHIHLLCKVEDESMLSDVIRDFKTYTSKKIIQTIKEYPESRREWMLDYFKNACTHLKRKQTYKVWQNGYHAEKVYSNKFIKQKTDYIHNNPVAEKIVAIPEDYVFSSARNYAELDSELEIIPLIIF